jgi:pimeloyl-ACP methyl ester carboxylesterase
MSKKIIFLLVPVALLVFYLAGPKPPRPEYSPDLPEIELSLDEMPEFIANRESNYRLKTDNEARIVWNNPENPQPTEYSLVYLHGFSASQQEGFPVHRQLAHKYGMNLYLSRLSDHGIDTTEAMAFLSPDRLWESAKFAFQVGSQLGNKVILMGTSTGGTLSLMLAATYNDPIAAVVNLSPNISINDPTVFIVNDPWGLQIARLVTGGKTRRIEETLKDPVERLFWYGEYRLEAVVALEQLVETAMVPETFSNVTEPVFNGYYYQDQENQDPVVRVDAILEMHDQLGTPDSLKKEVAFPQAGVHVIGYGRASGAEDEVLKEVSAWLETVLKIKKVNEPEKDFHEDEAEQLPHPIDLDQEAISLTQR